MSLLINMFAIGLTALILPGLKLIDNRFLVLAVMAAMLGLLNTFIKPILQLLTIRLLFVTYGLILIVTNTVVLLLIGWIFPNRIEIQGIFTAILGGIMIGLIGMFLDYVFGVIPPLGYQTHDTDVDLEEAPE
ncbi:MAG: phage holin family protein [Anderseniella sp.]|nr:phage holin family protein [Anderseniella sp.]